MFDEVTARLLGNPRITTGTGFGSNRGLRVDGRIFAIFMRDALTLKLPAFRIDELVAQGDAVRFDGGKGKPMREWVTVAHARQDEWADLVAEALRFVGGDEDAD